MKEQRRLKFEKGGSIMMKKLCVKQFVGVLNR